MNMAHDRKKRNYTKEGLCGSSEVGGELLGRANEGQLCGKGQMWLDTGWGWLTDGLDEQRNGSFLI